jgi:tRNA threonylcarbamoyladenosine biosynthesis protein TsaB
MRILALETSGQGGEVALLDGETIVATQMLDPAQRTARTLTPGMQAILARAGWQPREVQLVAVTIGPGSFTGLRVGVTAAKTLAYAIGGEALGVDTLEAIAAQAPVAASGKLWAVLDAQRSQLFAAEFVVASEAWEVSDPARIIDNEQYLAALAPGDIVTGSGLKRLASQLPPQVVVVEESLWTPRAATVGRLAWRDYRLGRRDDYWMLAPRYLRQSAAEEKRL